MDRRHFLKMLAAVPLATKSYFIFGSGLWRPAITIDMGGKIIYVAEASDSKILRFVEANFTAASMPLVQAPPYGWGHYRCVDGWKIKRTGVCPRG